MNDLEILKKLKVSYNHISNILDNININEEASANLQKSLMTLKNIYNSTYSNIVANKTDLTTDACCKNCNNNLLISDNIEYSYQCSECDENYYDFEVKRNKNWYEKSFIEDEKINSSFDLELTYDKEEDMVYLVTESGSGAKYKCTNMGELINNIEKYCYGYLDYGNKYSIEIWETDWHRDAGESFIYDETFENFDTALIIGRKLFEDNNYASIEILDNNGEAVYCRDNESEDFYFKGHRLSRVDENIVKDYIENWTNKKEQSFKGDKLYCKDNDVFIGVDNSTNNCWVEEFSSEKDVQDWLLGKDLESDFDYEI